MPKEQNESKTTYENERDREGRDAESVARMVFAFVSSVDSLVTELDGGNDVQLLRLRTRKYEIVIVPGKSYTGRTRVPLAYSLTDNIRLQIPPCRYTRPTKKFLIPY